MSVYRDRATGEYPITREQAASRFPGALPHEWDQSVLDLLGIDEVFTVPAPIVGPTQTAREVAPKIDSNGRWHQAYEIVELYENATERAGAELALLQARALEIIDTANREAGEQRSLYITVVVGQTSTYQAKADEAKRYLSDPNPDPASYPYIVAEAEETNDTPAAVAASVAATEAQWTLINARIEAKRRGISVKATKAVDDNDLAALNALLPINWS